MNDRSPLEAPTSRPRRSRLRNRVAGSLVSIVLFFLFGEIVSRSFHLVDRLNGFPRQLYEANDSEDLPYQLRRSIDTMARGHRVIIDADGLRVGTPEAEPEENATTVLLLGDSVAFGYRMDFEDTLGVRLESIVEEESGQNFIVRNGGVEGYNTVHQLAWLRRNVDHLDPDLVIVIFNLNDYDWGPVMGPSGVLTTDRSQRVSRFSLASQSDFYVLLRWLVALARAPSPPPAVTEAEGRTARFDRFDSFVSLLRKRYYAAPDDERWDQMVEALAGLADETARRDLPLLIAIVPDGDQIGVDAPDPTPQRRLADVCRDLGISCFDLWPIFDAASGEEPLFLDIMHPNERGHELIARALAPWVLRSR